MVAGTRAWAWAWFEYLVLASLAFIPQLASQPGVVDSDTKSYLLIDPGRFLRQSASMWDPSFALGTVTHQQLGYLFPLGPYFWATDGLGIPVWVAERLWVGATLFAAGAGVVYLARVLRASDLSNKAFFRDPGILVGAVAYMLSPYFLQYVGRISVILLSWAGLPWMIGLLAQALRGRGWKYPALFALVTLAAGGVNASSLIYVGVGPVLWLLYSVIGSREHTWRQVWSAFWRTGLLTLGVSVWWIVGLEIEGSYGLDILKYTETVQAVSQTSFASEVIRGLGYWYFYGSDRLGQWVSTSVQFTQQVWLIATSFAVPAAAFVGGIFSRWRHRGFFCLLVVVGLVLSVGVNPFNDPSPLGALLKWIMTDTTAGLAMRSTDRASPLLLLGTAMLLGSGVSAVSQTVQSRAAGTGAAGSAARRTWPSRVPGLATAGLAVALVCSANPAVFNGSTVADNFTQPAPLPSYLTDATSALNAQAGGQGPDATRVLAIPGDDFATYRFGDTVDTVYPALLTRPFAQREQQEYGSLATQDILYAVDDPLQEGAFVPSGLAPMAALMSAGDVLVQNNLAYERYDTPMPQVIDDELEPTPPGLGSPAGYGEPQPNVSLIPEVDEVSEALSPDNKWESPIEVYPVDDPRKIVRTEPQAAPLVLDGDAEGIDYAADAGLLSGNPTILYAGSLDSTRGSMSQVAKTGATLVLTDTNRKRGFRWNSVAQNAGYTETAAQPKSNDPTDEPIDLFPDAPSDAQAVTVFEGVKSVLASDYGNDLQYLPEDRPSVALDGNTQTAWQTSAFANADGQWWQVTLDRPETTDRVNLLQVINGNPTRWITHATLSFDGGRDINVALGPSSRSQSGAGQTITFPERTFTTLRITIDSTNLSQKENPASLPGVGFAEVRIPGVSMHEYVELPEDMLRAVGTSSIDNRLVIVLTRLRVAPEPPRSDPETSISRIFWLPTARTFMLTGEAAIDAAIPDDAIDRLVGRPGSNFTGIVAYSSGRLPGDLQDGAQAALDGNPSTMWSPGFGSQALVDPWIEVNLPNPITVDHLNLQIVADGHHSVPTEIMISACDQLSVDSHCATSPLDSAEVKLPAIADGRRQGNTVSVPISFRALTGRYLTFTFTGIRKEASVNYYSQTPLDMPIGIAELGIPGIHVQQPPATIPAVCTDKLLTVDGKPVWIRVAGSSASALKGQELPFSLCGPDARGLPLSAGTHTVVATYGHANGAHSTGWDLDQIVLDSAAGGKAEPDAAGSPVVPPTVPGGAPNVKILSATATKLHLEVSKVNKPFWLVLGETQNKGWTAKVDGGPTLGGSSLMDGFANGWKVDPSSFTKASSFDVTLYWTPQERVWAALGISGLTAVICVLLAVIPERTRRWRPKWLGGPRPVVPKQVAVVTADDRPRLASPLSYPRSARRPVLGIAVLAGAVAGLIAATLSTPWSPWIGLPVGALVTASALIRQLRFLLTLSSIGLVAGAGLFVVLGQARNHYMVGASWPANFETAGLMVSTGVLMLGADALVERIRCAPGRDVPSAADAPPRAGRAASQPRSLPS